jgi:aminoglycoside 3-N-acetyltransferase
MTLIKAKPMADDHREPGAREGGLSLEDLVRELRAFGVHAGQTLLVHASLRSLGWVDGGAATVVEALRQAVEKASGNVVVFTGTEANSTTSRAHKARIAGMSAVEVAQFRNQMRAFELGRTPSGSGRIAEELRTTPGAVRSGHPQSSFAAIGPRAGELMSGHALNCHHGPRSPLGRMYDLADKTGLDVAILMLGVGYRACTALHLAEYLSPLKHQARYPATRTYSCVTTVGRRSRWTVYRDAELDDSDFEEIGNSLDKEEAVHQGDVGVAPSRLLPFRTAVNLASEWMRDNRR